MENIQSNISEYTLKPLTPENMVEIEANATILERIFIENPEEIRKYIPSDILESMIQTNLLLRNTKADEMAKSVYEKGKELEEAIIKEGMENLSNVDEQLDKINAYNKEIDRLNDKISQKKNLPGIYLSLAREYFRAKHDANYPLNKKRPDVVSGIETLLKIYK